MIKAIVGFIIGILIGFILFAVTPLGNRYFFIKKDDELTSIYRFDTWTGQAWWCIAEPKIQARGCIEITKDKYDPEYK